MEGSKGLGLHLTEAKLETLINAARGASDGPFAELEFKLRAAWRRALLRSDYSCLFEERTAAIQWGASLNLYKTAHCELARGAYAAVGWSVSTRRIQGWFGITVGANDQPF